METYSSPISVAELLRGGDRRERLTGELGVATVEPDAEGSRLPNAVTSARTAAGSAPTAASSGAAMPSPCARSAPSRCVGPTSGLPASEAACTAAEMACCVLVVGLKLSIPRVLLR